MQQFALAQVPPRSIAWLIRPDEWDRFETIVLYNCAMLGGYFNVVIPLTEQDTLGEASTRFLVDYDPDLVILAPGMTDLSVDSQTQLHPFGFVRWETMNDIASKNPNGHWTGINATIGSGMGLRAADLAKNMLVAIADPAYPDTSRYAFVACGDIEPDGQGSGYRELFLNKLLKPGYTLTGATDRSQLGAIILDDHKFPLTGAINLLQMSFQLDHHFWRSTFINLTANYKWHAKYARFSRTEPTPAVVVLVSDAFTLSEAILVWNLRAADIPVAWLPFAELLADLPAVVGWLSKGYGILSPTRIAVSGVMFAAPANQVARLQNTLTALPLPQAWSIVSYDELPSYQYQRPFIKQEHVLIAENGGSHSFVPPFPDESYTEEMYALTLKWDGLLLPQDRNFIQDCVSQEEAPYRPRVSFLRTQAHVPDNCGYPRYAGERTPTRTGAEPLSLKTKQV